METSAARVAAAVDLAIVLVAIAVAWASSRWVIYPALGIPDYAPLILRPITGFLVAWWVLRRRGLTWASVGLRRPSSLWIAVAITVVAYLVEMALWHWAVPVIAEWFQPTRRPSFLGHLHGNAAALAFWLAIAWLVGGICEECLFRGFLLNRVEALVGAGAIALAIGVVAQAVLFGMLHLYAGTFGFLYASLFGVVHAMFYLLARRNLWPGIIVHGLWDSIAFYGVFSS